jgi:transcription antitermination factor NusA-like protein
MKICSVCLNSDLLCGGCSRKLEKRIITETDVNVSRAVFKLGFDAEFLRSVDSDKCIVLLADSRNSGLLIGRGGRNARRLSIMLGKDIRVIEQINDERKLIEKIINTPVLGINKIYGKSELYKVRLERRFKNRVENLVPLVSKVINKDVTIVFE